jgi:formimidoylglutamate deiminase
MPVHMHVSEQTREVDECRAAHGKTPLEWIREVVEIDAHWCLIHATHLTHEERQAAAAAQAVVGLCPTTEANLGDGIFDFDAWFARRAPWGIGGDSHVSVSPFEELRALEESQRLRIRVRNVAASAGEPDVPANLWRGAAHGGARALGQPAGVLEAGSRADFIVLDRGDARFEGLEADRLLGAAMFGGSSVRVRDVFVAGRAVVQEGHHARDAQARAAFRAALRRLRS